MSRLQTNWTQENFSGGSTGTPQSSANGSQEQNLANRSSHAPPIQPEDDSVFHGFDPPNLNHNAPPFLPRYPFADNQNQANFSGGSTDMPQACLNGRNEHNRATLSINAPPSQAPSVTTSPPVSNYGTAASSASVQPDKGGLRYDFMGLYEQHHLGPFGYTERDMEDAKMLKQQQAVTRPQRDQYKK